MGLWATRQAERRWRRINAENKARGCPCGKPAEVAAEYSVLGKVPYQWWTCREHEGAESFAGRTAMWHHSDGPLRGDPTDCPLGMASGWSSRIGGPIEQYHCPHRVHV